MATKAKFRIDLDLRSAAAEREVGKRGSGKFATYLSWMAAIGFARKESGEVEQTVIEFDGAIAKPVFGGAVVAVDQVFGPITQRCYLPLQDGGYRSIKFDDLTGRDIGDGVSRCRAKSIAITTGVGLGLYAGYAGNGPQFAEDLGEITDATDLATIAPLIKVLPNKAQTAYIPWPVSLAAAKLADPAFHWKVEQRELVNHATGEVRNELFVPMGTGFAVGVTVTYRGLAHTEWLPILGVVEVNGKKRDNMALTASDPKLDSSSWNKAVMRCLTKAIAAVTGYGLAFYAKTDMSFFDHEEDEAHVASRAPAAQQPAPAQAAPAAAAAPANPPAAPTSDAAPALIAQIKALAAETDTAAEFVLGMVGVKSIREATPAQLETLVKVLTRKKERFARENNARKAA